MNEAHRSQGRLAGSVAMITGGAAGQGAETSRLFVAAGASVVIGDVNDEAGRAVARELGPAAAYSHVDVGVEQDWEAFSATAMDAFGAVDVLINNAGIHAVAALEETSPDLLERLYRVNAVGPILGMACVAPLMRARGGGAIVNVSSTAAAMGTPGKIAYAAAKWALRGASRSAAGELASAGIRVNCVLPGLIDTAMAAENPAEYNFEIIKRTPLGRMGSASEVASVSLFLASRESSFVTGAEVIVDGGGTA